jgi:hydroxymethylpyrimidine pyrophosphatase-like HAD family hydrolase
MKTIAFDVDGTLVHDGNPSFTFISPLSGIQEPKTDMPRYDVIQMLLQYRVLGWDIYVWSGGGIDYAKHWADKLGLSVKVVEKGSFKPDIAVDDMDVNLGIVNIKV